VLGWVQLLNTGRLPPERIQQAIEVIGRNARLQAQLVEDLLDVSRIISGKLEIERDAVSIQQVIDNVVGGISPAAEAKRIKFTRDLDACPEIVGDAKRLEQVVANVLSNAVKFTAEGGRIDLRCKVRDGVIEIEVQDNGVGIAPEFLPYVFDRFRQADSRSTRSHGGLGLGLAIARHLLQLHGGEIEAHSAGAGRGTTVRIRVPADVRPELAPSLTPARGVAFDIHQRLDGTSVVVVDDEPDSREVVGTLLEGNGARVFQCPDAASAILHVQSSRVDLLVADLAMPEMDGYELIRQVRSFNPDVPAVAVSAYARFEDRAKALGAGYTGYCAKPIDTSELMRVVREAIRSVGTRPSVVVATDDQTRGAESGRARAAE
jgi:CheY-like chemotaxis protein